jgi:hypothetical protein
MTWSKVNIHTSYTKLPALYNKLSHGYIPPFNYIIFYFINIYNAHTLYYNYIYIYQALN